MNWSIPVRQTRYQPLASTRGANSARGASNWYAFFKTKYRPKLKKRKSADCLVLPFSGFGFPGGRGGSFVPADCLVLWLNLFWQLSHGCEFSVFTFFPGGEVLLSQLNPNHTAQDCLYIFQMGMHYVSWSILVPKLIVKVTLPSPLSLEAAKRHNTSLYAMCSKLALIQNVLHEKNRQTISREDRITAVSGTKIGYLLLVGK